MHGLTVVPPLVTIAKKLAGLLLFQFNFLFTHLIQIFYLLPPPLVAAAAAETYSFISC